MEFGTGQRIPYRIKNGLSLPLKSNKLHVVVALVLRRPRIPKSFTPSQFRQQISKSRKP
jgi:hypothetical protein